MYFYVCMVYLYYGYFYIFHLLKWSGDFTSKLLYIVCTDITLIFLLSIGHLQAVRIKLN